MLLSDGELHDGLDAVRDSATAAFAAGVRVWTAGIGTPAGREISTPTGEPLLDASGRPVRSRLDEDVLTAVARAGGGSFVRADRDGAATLARGLGRGSPGGTAPDLAWLLLVVALGAIACEGALDAGRLPLARSTR